MTSRVLASLVSALLLTSLGVSVSGEAAAQQQAARSDWGISQQDWFNAPGAVLRAKVDLVRQRAALEAAAAVGDSRAQVLSAIAYQRGAWGPVDLPRATQLARAAAQQGDGRGIGMLGDLYLADPATHAEGVRLLSDAANRKVGIAAAVLGNMYASGRGIAKDPALAVTWYQKAAEAGSVLGMRFLAFALVNGEGVVADAKRGAGWAEKAAAMGDEDAMRLLGVLYAGGLGVPKDDRLAVDWYRKASDAGSAEASRELAARYEAGRGVEKDLGKAVAFYERGANAGDAKSAARLGVMHGSQMLGKPNYALAERWLKPAAAAGDVESAYLLAVLYASDESGLKAPEMAAPLWRQAAEGGDKRAMRYWGLALIRAEGVALNEAEGVAWLYKAAEAGDEESVRFVESQKQKQAQRQAPKPTDPASRAALYRQGAEAGDAGAMSSLAFALANGDGVAKDDAQALQWATKAAGRGDASAMRLLGVLWDAGRATPKNPVTATGWFTKSAEAGDRVAMYVLALRLRDGEGTAKSPERSVQWLRKAAEAGHVPSKRSLAFAYVNGEGTPKDEAAGAAWALKAAQDGDAEAMRLMGVLASGGRGVPQDPAAATDWFRKSAEAGSVAAMSSYGDRLAAGTGVKKDAYEAAKWWKTAAEGGDVSAMTSLAYALFNADGVYKSVRDSTTWAQRAAKAGDVNAMRLMGVLAMHPEKYMGPEDGSSIYWYTKAVAGGSKSSAINLYVAIDKKQGSAQEAAQAVKLLTGLCDAGEAKACSYLGEIYETSDGLVARDWNASARYFTKACDGNVGHSCWRLAMSYVIGSPSTPKNHAKAAALYKRSLSLGGLTEQQERMAQTAALAYDKYGRIDPADWKR